MIEFKTDDTGDWIQTETSVFKLTPSFVMFSLRINGVVYTKLSRQFVEAFQKEKMWENLNDLRN